MLESCFFRIVTDELMEICVYFCAEDLCLPFFSFVSYIVPLDFTEGCILELMEGI